MDSHREHAGTVEDAVAYCADQVRKHDSDRFATVLFAPRPHRPALWALYALNLEMARVREAASNPLIGQMRLQWWRDALDGIFAGQPRRHPVAVAVAAVAGRVDRPLLETLIDAREADLEEDPPATMAALAAYAEGTSASLVQLALGGLEVREPAAMEAGRHVGVCWALTGLLRATAFHARMTRVHLPAETLAEAGSSPEQVLALRPDPSINRAVAAVAGLAASHLAEARRLRRDVPRAALPALLPATLASGYLKLLRRVRHNPFDPRIVAPLPSRSWRLLSATVTGQY